MCKWNIKRTIEKARGLGWGFLTSSPTPARLAGCWNPALPGLAACGFPSCLLEHFVRRFPPRHHHSMIVIGRD